MMKKREMEKGKAFGMIVALILFAAGILLTGFAWAAEKQELMVWHSKATLRGQIWAKMVDEFNAKHPNIKVTATYQGGYEQTVQKLTTSIAGNATPDVAEIPQTRGIMEFAASGKLLPLDDFMAKGEKDDFYEAALARYTVNGKLYAIPNAVSTSLLYYNADLFKEAGLDPNKPPQTWDDVVAYGKKLTRDTDGDGKPDKWGLLTHTTVNYFIFAMIYQNGGRLFDEKGNPAFNTPETAEALQFWSDLVHKHKIMPPLTHAAANKLFVAGTGGMMYQSTSFIETLDKGVGNRFVYKTAFFPKKKNWGTDVGGTGLGIFRSNPAREKAAYEFVKWMTDTERSAYWSENTGYIAARKSSFKLPSHQKFLEKNPNNRTAGEQMPYAAVMPVSKGDNIIYKPFLTLIEKLEADPNVNIKKELDDIARDSAAKMKEK
jgi:sn-glycerol 3-phosphate transport system substrate-binding protein